jgi:hypothetical protein
MGEHWLLRVELRETGHKYPSVCGHLMELGVWSSEDEGLEYGCMFPWHTGVASISRCLF